MERTPFRRMGASGRGERRKEAPVCVRRPDKDIGNGKTVGMTCGHRIKKHHPTRAQGLGQRDHANPRGPSPKGAAIEQGQRRRGPQWVGWLALVTLAE